jgi:hypothetical protein
MSGSPHGDHDLGRRDATIYLRLLAESGTSVRHPARFSNDRMPLLRFLRLHTIGKQLENGTRESNVLRVHERLPRDSRHEQIASGARKRLRQGIGNSEDSRRSFNQGFQATQRSFR